MIVLTTEQLWRLVLLAALNRADAERPAFFNSRIDGLLLAE